MHRVKNSWIDNVINQTMSLQNEAVHNLLEMRGISLVIFFVQNVKETNRPILG